MVQSVSLEALAAETTGEVEAGVCAGRAGALVYVLAGQTVCLQQVPLQARAGEAPFHVAAVVAAAAVFFKAFVNIYKNKVFESL